MYRDPVPKNSWVFLTGGRGLSLYMCIQKKLNMQNWKKLRSKVARGNEGIMTGRNASAK